MNNSIRVEARAEAPAREQPESRCWGKMERSFSRRRPPMAAVSSSVLIPYRPAFPTCRRALKITTFDSGLQSRESGKSKRNETGAKSRENLSSRTVFFRAALAQVISKKIQKRKRNKAAKIECTVKAYCRMKFRKNWSSYLRRLLQQWRRKRQEMLNSKSSPSQV